MGATGCFSRCLTHHSPYGFIIIPIMAYFSFVVVVIVVLVGQSGRVVHGAGGMI